MSDSFKLFRLQQVDSQLDKARARLEEIHQALLEDAALRGAESQVRLAEQSLEKAQKELKRAEVAVGDQQVKIEQNQAALYSGNIKNPKELQDLQQESEALSRYLVTLEDEQLEHMLAQEDAERTLSNAQTKLGKVQAQVAEKNSSLSDEQADLQKEVARLEGERQAAVTGIPPEDLRMYEKLRQKRAGMAVAKVNNQTCSACGTTLSQALVQASRSRSQISRCSTCGRILYAGQNV